MDHMKLTDELRAVLIESAAFVNAERAPIIEESSEVVEESVEVVEESAEVEETEEAEVVEESEEEVHVCPLCVSQLDESIDEERILDHLNVVMGLVDRLSQINEGDEDIESVIADAVTELLLVDDEDEA